MMTVNEYLDIVLSDFRQEMLKKNSLKDCYRAMPKEYFPKAHMTRVLHEILVKKAESKRWKELGETAPSYTVVKNMLNDRTNIKPLYKEAWSEELNIPLERIL